ncbi:MAG: aminotransferase class I/II-fold pyridoxal phosphate-dependent enzyme [Bacteroidales bacterium]|nr:aminotransferase class I/II-fold pyridoxal phosphate-dependent enzyme [Bacteroidales bacterium]
MQAIILAAGMGKRLGEKTRDNTKCMLEVNGIRLIDRALESLHEAGISRVILVVGYKGENVREYIGDQFKGMPVVYVNNDVYDKTNNIYSLFLARDFMCEEDSLLLESDIIFEPRVLQRILDDPYPNLALVDKYESWMDGTVVTLDDERRIKRFIDKSGFRYDEIKSYFKTVNIYKFSKEFSSRYYVPFLKAYSTALGDNEYYEQVLRVILHLHDAPIRALPLEGETWYEIDDVQDLDIAEGMFSPTREGHFKAISSRYGGYWRYPQMLDFCYLVNPFFPPQRMIDEIKASFETLLREYPSGMDVNTLLASKNFKVKPQHILVGNGAAELIKALMEREDGKTGCILPTFEEYPNRIPEDRLVCWTPEREGFRYSAEDLIRFFEDKGLACLILINPDNPSGNLLSREELARIIAWAEAARIRLVIDESFADFAEPDLRQTLLSDSLLEAHPGLVVIKSISKSYGVPGLRLGILASGDETLVERLKKDVAIWNINSFGEFYLQVFEKYEKDYVMACEAFRTERERFGKALSEIPWLHVYPSQANYFLCRVVDRFSSHELALKLLEHHILIKDCSTKKAFGGESFIRLAIRDPKDNNKLIACLKSLEA